MCQILIEALWVIMSVLYLPGYGYVDPNADANTQLQTIYAVDDVWTIHVDDPVLMQQFMNTDIIGFGSDSRGWRYAQREYSTTTATPEQRCAHNEGITVYDDYGNLIHYFGDEPDIRTYLTHRVFMPVVMRSGE